MFSVATSLSPSDHPTVAASVLRESPGDYGRRRARYYEADGGQSITERAERRVAAEAPAQLEALLARTDLVRQDLDADAYTRWLELEEALHAYWMQVSIAHYELGVTSGLRRTVRTSLSELPPRAQLQALAEALQALARELPE